MESRCTTILAQHLCSNFFLLAWKSTTCAIFVVVFCVLCEPNCDAQGMDGVGCSYGVDPGAPRTEATFSTVAIVEAPCKATDATTKFL